MIVRVCKVPLHVPVHGHGFWPIRWLTREEIQEIYPGPGHATLQLGPTSSRSPVASADSMEKPKSIGSDGESG